VRRLDAAARFNAAQASQELWCRDRSNWTAAKRGKYKSFHAKPVSLERAWTESSLLLLEKLLCNCRKSIAARLLFSFS
jgi:hypothetical protein